MCAQTVYDMRSMLSDVVQNDWQWTSLFSAYTQTHTAKIFNINVKRGVDNNKMS